jgi:hypothetical protein
MARSNRAAANSIGGIRPTPTWLPRGCRPAIRGGLVVRGDHLGRDRRSLNWKLPARYAGLDARCTPPMASVGRDTCPHRAHQNCAGQRSKTAKRAIFAVERKLLRRCCYSLRKLGDASPAMPAARSRRPRRVGATASRGRASTSTNVGSSRRGGCLGAAVTPRPFASPAQTGPELEVEIVRLCKANTRWGAHTIHAQPTRTGAPVGSGDINDSPCAATQSLIGMARPALRSTGLAALRALRAQ